MSFILIDRIDVLEAGVRAAGVKCVALSDPVFVDHFPEHPIFPGSLLIEAMAQLGGCLAEASYHAEQPDTRRALLIQADRAKFHQPVRPGDQLGVECRVASLLGHAVQIEAQVSSVRGEVAQAVLNFRLMTVDSPTLHQSRRALYRQWLAHWERPPELR